MTPIHPDLQLTAAEIDALMRVEKTLRIATVGPGSAINLTPMTFGWANGKCFIFGRGQKVSNLRRNPTATVLVDVGSAWRELQGVMLQGSARVLEDAQSEADEADLAAAQLNLGEKHGLVEDGAVKPYTATASGRSRRWIVFTPERSVTWNNQNLDRLQR